MSNSPKTYEEAVNLARQSQQTNVPADTRNWSYNSRVTYAANGGK